MRELFVPWGKPEDASLFFARGNQRMLHEEGEFKGASQFGRLAL